MQKAYSHLSINHITSWAYNKGKMDVLLFFQKQKSPKNTRSLLVRGHLLHSLRVGRSAKNHNACLPPQSCKEVFCQSVILYLTHPRSTWKDEDDNKQFWSKLHSSKSHLVRVKTKKKKQPVALILNFNSYMIKSLQFRHKWPTWVATARGCLLIWTLCHKLQKYPKYIQSLADITQMKNLS